jgi:hypothetical protein
VGGSRYRRGMAVSRGELFGYVKNAVVDNEKIVSLLA